MMTNFDTTAARLMTPTVRMMIAEEFTRTSSLFGLSQRIWWRGPGNISPAIETAEHIINRCSPKLLFDDGEMPRYEPGVDTIVIPHRYRWDTIEKYYIVLLHEMIHWSGAKHRLNRRTLVCYDDCLLRSEEELIADTGAVVMARMLGLTDPDMYRTQTDWISFNFGDVQLKQNILDEIALARLTDRLTNEIERAVQFIIGDYHVQTVSDQTTNEESLPGYRVSDDSWYRSLVAK